MKCPHKSKCKLYDLTSETCNHNQLKEDGYPYCGYYRQLENEK